MNVTRGWGRPVAIGLAGAMAVNSLPMGMAQAGIVTTEQVIEQTNADPARAKLATLLQRADVRAKLVEYGVNPDEAAARIASLTDAEVAQLSSRIGDIPAGGDGVGTAIGIGLLILLILLIMDLMGVIDIFPGVGPARAR